MKPLKHRRAGRATTDTTGCTLTEPSDYAPRPSLRVLPPPTYAGREGEQMSVTIRVQTEQVKDEKVRKALEKTMKMIREYQPVDGFIIYMVKGGKAQLTGVMVEEDDITSLIHRLILLFPDQYNRAVIAILSEAAVEGVNN